MERRRQTAEFPSRVPGENLGEVRTNRRALEGCRGSEGLVAPISFEVLASVFFFSERVGLAAGQKQ
jgi:hypothetical protein